MIVRSLNARKVTVELDWDEVQWFGIELPQKDMVGFGWWKHVWKPMMNLREEEGLPLDD